MTAIFANCPSMARVPDRTSGRTGGAPMPFRNSGAARLSRRGRQGGRRYQPHRSGAEHLQVISVRPISGRVRQDHDGGGILPNISSCMDLQVLANRSTSKSAGEPLALHGYQPEFDIRRRTRRFMARSATTSAGAIEGDRPSDYFPGLDIARAISNSWSSSTKSESAQREEIAGRPVHRAGRAVRSARRRRIRRRV